VAWKLFSSDRSKADLRFQSVGRNVENQKFGKGGNYMVVGGRSLLCVWVWIYSAGCYGSRPGGGRLRGGYLVGEEWPGMGQFSIWGESRGGRDREPEKDGSGVSPIGSLA